MATMHLQNRINPLRLQIVPKVLTGMLLSFLENEGMCDLLKRCGAFSFDEFSAAAQRALHYELKDPVKIRMMKVVLDFLTECGYLARLENSKFLFTPERAMDKAAYRLDDRETDLKKAFSGEFEFFHACLDEATGFLRGTKAPVGFSTAYERLWDGFLGNIEFATIRRLLLSLMDLENNPGFRVLDLCYGVGHGLSAILSGYPNIRLAALDRENVYKKAALKKTEGFDVEFISEQWDGFGSRLPIDDASFDAVHFMCADPYVPPGKRDGVYGEIKRVLKPGGTLGLMTWSYPEEDGAQAQDPWRRRQILAHDFIESVCAGWQGFYKAGETREMFERLGFRPKKTILPLEPSLSSVLWVMERP